jgi:hypothetical protein
MNNETNGNAKLEKLRPRDAALKAAIAVEQVKQQRAKAKLQAREFAAVGAAVCAYASRSAEFRGMVSEALPVVCDAKTREFLVSRGWPVELAGGSGR